MDAQDATHSLDGIGVAWRLGATLFFVALNGFFVAAEFSLVKLRTVRIDALADEGSRAASNVQHIVGHLDRYLSACQLGITLASLVLGALGEPAVSVLLVAAAGGLGLPVGPDAPWLPIVSIGIAFLVITVLHMTVGEQAPKMWALRRAEGTALRTAFLLRGFTWIFGPFIAAINAISNWMLRVAGLPQESAHESSHTSEEIRSILSLSASAGHISERQVELTENVLRIVDLEVRHIVVPRIDVEYLSLERDAEENRRTLQEGSHSRLPLCEAGLDTIVGFVHVKDVLASGSNDLRGIAREPLFVPDTMPLSSFLRELQSQRQHCAAVVDEHGTTIGLAFREDVLEEIVGPLGDEFDEEEDGFAQLPGGVFEVSGRLAIPDVCERAGLELDEDEGEETIGGLVTALLGRLPRQGDAVRIGRHRATVLAVTRRRVERVRIAPSPEEADDSA